MSVLFGLCEVPENVIDRFIGIFLLGSNLKWWNLDFNIAQKLLFQHLRHLLQMSVLFGLCEVEENVIERFIGIFLLGSNLKWWNVDMTFAQKLIFQDLKHLLHMSVLFGLCEVEENVIERFNGISGRIQPKMEES
jgi:hypothetical protein